MIIDIWTTIIIMIITILIKVDMETIILDRLKTWITIIIKEKIDLIVIMIILEKLNKNSLEDQEHLIDIINMLI